MKLIQFSVRNYRSITEGYKLPLDQYAVLVGPNNEGKSNVLRAIVLSLRTLIEGRWVETRHRRISRFRSREDEDFKYDWDRDFPIQLQESNPEGISIFTLEFELTAPELRSFKSRTGVKLNSSLKIKLSMGRDDAKIDILMQGKAKEALVKKLDKVVATISENIFVQYIPSIRTSEMAIDVVEGMLRRELFLLEKDENYRKLMNEIAKIQAPVLANIGRELTKSIRGFVPDVKRVRIDARGFASRSMSSSPKILVDDGVDTDLKAKGDGIKSLIAISLLRHSTTSALKGKSLILCVEEPESHLHPRAIHQLADALKGLAEKQQVFLTTHSQELVDRGNSRRNIIVEGNHAKPAERLSEVRDSLGVRLSDNLASAYLVLLVEGQDDKRIVASWLTGLSPSVKNRLVDGSLAVESLNGVHNLGHRATMFRAAVCNVFVFVDNDEAARTAVREALDEGAFSEKDYVMASHKSFVESELEDLIDMDVYSEAVLSKYGVDLTKGVFRSNSGKWSVRIKAAFMGEGKLWDEAIRRDIKRMLADRVGQQGISSIKPTSLNLVRGLASRLEGLFATAS